jgi:hypothetical protein
MHNPGVSRRGTAKAYLARGNSFFEIRCLKIRIGPAAPSGDGIGASSLRWANGEW